MFGGPIATSYHVTDAIDKFDPSDPAFDNNDENWVSALQARYDAQSRISQDRASMYSPYYEIGSTKPQNITANQAFDIINQANTKVNLGDKNYSNFGQLMTSSHQNYVDDLNEFSQLTPDQNLQLMNRQSAISYGNQQQVLSDSVHMAQMEQAQRFTNQPSDTQITNQRIAQQYGIRGIGANQVGTSAMLSRQPGFQQNMNNPRMNMPGRGTVLGGTGAEPDPGQLPAGMNATPLAPGVTAVTDRGGGGGDEEGGGGGSGGGGSGSGSGGGGGGGGSGGGGGGGSGGGGGGGGGGGKKKKDEEEEEEKKLGEENEKHSEASTASTASTPDQKERDPRNDIPWRQRDPKTEEAHQQAKREAMLAEMQTDPRYKDMFSDEPLTSHEKKLRDGRPKLKDDPKYRHYFRNDPNFIFPFERRNNKPPSPIPEDQSVSDDSKESVDLLRRRSVVDTSSKATPVTQRGGGLRSRTQGVSAAQQQRGRERAATARKRSIFNPPPAPGLTPFEEMKQRVNASYIDDSHVVDMPDEFSINSGRGGQPSNWNPATPVSRIPSGLSRASDAVKGLLGIGSVSDDFDQVYPKEPSKKKIKRR